MLVSSESTQLRLGSLLSCGRLRRLPPLIDIPEREDKVPREMLAGRRFRVAAVIAAVLSHRIHDGPGRRAAVAERLPGEGIQRHRAQVLRYECCERFRPVGVLLSIALGGNSDNGAAELGVTAEEA